MSILSVMPAEWWEPADLIDEEEDVAVYPSDAFTVFASGWWSAGADLEDTK
jgi:hypothetical protein